MPKPIRVINPITGQQSFTKHPEKLIRRQRAKYEGEQLIIIAKTHPCYWNGDQGAWKQHRPGEVRS